MPVPSGLPSRSMRRLDVKCDLRDAKPLQASCHRDTHVMQRERGMFQGQQATHACLALCKACKCMSVRARLAEAEETRAALPRSVKVNACVPALTDERTRERRRCRRRRMRRRRWPRCQQAWRRPGICGWAARASRRATGPTPRPPSAPRCASLVHLLCLVCVPPDALTLQVVQQCRCAGAGKVQFPGLCLCQPLPGQTNICAAQLKRGSNRACCARRRAAGQQHGRGGRAGACGPGAGRERRGGAGRAVPVSAAHA